MKVIPELSETVMIGTQYVWPAGEVWPAAVETQTLTQNSINLVKSLDPIAVKIPEGLRFDEGKARFDLLPPEAIEELARHYGKGAVKYVDRNWEKGMSWGRCFASMMRHAWAFWRGEDFDPENGTHHMVAVAWNAIAIYTYATRNIGTDDRHKG